MWTSNLIKTMLQRGMKSGHKIYSTLNCLQELERGVNCYPLWAQSRQPPSPASGELQVHRHYLLRQKTNIIIIIITCVSSKAKIETKNAYTLRGGKTSDWGLVAIQRESFLKNLFVELNKPVDRQITRIEYPPSLDNDSKVGPKNLCNRHRPPVIPS